MAPKKKRPPSRPQSGSRPAAKRPGPPPAKATSRAGGPAQAAPRAGGPTKASPKPGREKTGPTRSERLAAAEAARRRKAARSRALIAGGLVAVLALLTVTIVNSRRSNAAVVSKLESSGACKYDADADNDDGAGQNHVPGDVTYKTDPPAGGNHNPTAASPGTYTAENMPPDAKVVHALEHGYVTLWYRPELDPPTLSGLQALAGRYPKDVLLVPRPSLTNTPVAATAWHRRLLCERPDQAALERFITAYRNKGPEKVPH